MISVRKKSLKEGLGKKARGRGRGGVPASRGSGVSARHRTVHFHPFMGCQHLSIQRCESKLSTGAMFYVDEG